MGMNVRIDVAEALPLAENSTVEAVTVRCCTREDPRQRWLLSFVEVLDAVDRYR